ncbi:hypothetical protein J2S21_004622 [Peribacillus cavernae]|nr:hypothetical protein [Peribacillus cavernae]
MEYSDSSLGTCIPTSEAGTKGSVLHTPTGAANIVQKSIKKDWNRTKWK